MKSYHLVTCTALISSSYGFITPNVPTNNRVAISSLKMSFLTPPPVSIESLSSLLLSDEAITAVVTDPATTDAASSNGWFGFLTGPIEFLLQVIHQGFVTVGLDANSWGLSIAAMTILIKLLTYPLTKQQLESTSKMQEMQPVIKNIQSTYASNPEVMNQKIAEIYKTEGVNPLAGCIPAIIQLPVFIGLYRAVLTLAKENKLDQPFLWLPSLEGPTYGADPAQGSDWILKGWVDGVPTLGWADTIAFLSIPIFLVISQSISQQLMQPQQKTQGDQPGQEANAVLKFLPLLIGWFSLNVPSALGIYWVANNVVTTLLTLQIRSSLETSSSGGGAAVMEAPRPKFTPTEMPEMKPKPSGFGSSASLDDDGVKQITTSIDAEIVEEEEAQVVQQVTKSQEKKRGKGKKKKRSKN